MKSSHLNVIGKLKQLAADSHCVNVLCCNALTKQAVY